MNNAQRTQHRGRTRELSLHGAREIGILHNTVDRRLDRKDRVEVGHILYMRRQPHNDETAEGIRTTGLVTFGLNGGWIFFWCSFLKSILAKNACFLISAAPFTPSRCVGSRLSSSCKMLCASAPISGGKTRGSFKIFSYILSVTSVWRMSNGPGLRVFRSTDRRRMEEDPRASQRAGRPTSTSQLSCLLQVSLIDEN